MTVAPRDLALAQALQLLRQLAARTAFEPASDDVPVTITTSLDDPVGLVEWSPDGRFLAFTVAPGGGMNSQIY